MYPAVLQLLTCPICSYPLTATADEKSCRCTGEKSHCFDFSKSGYLNLLCARAKEGDSKEAIQARRLFLEAGYYQPLVEKILAILRQIPSHSLLDAGCGEGYYTNQFAVDGRVVLGIDLSKTGVDYAARRAKQLQNRAGFAVASVFQLPVADAGIDIITNLFAPCAEEEFSRALKPGGHLLLVGAGEKHLLGLKRAIYEHPYKNEGRADLPKTMELLDTVHLCYEITLESAEHIQALFSMTPYYWRTSPKDREKLNGIQTLTTEVEFDIFLFRKGQKL